jgi:phage repressor protein C with HTH and peptisase S24 domain
MEIDQRAALEALIRERREDYAGLSRMIGRNPAYIQQFIKRGTPRRLSEEDRRSLAAYFGVAESRLGGGAPEERNDGAGAGLFLVPKLDVGASAGPGTMAGGEQGRGRMAFDRRWLRELTGAAPSALSVIRVQGDSMEPTLGDGDDIMVDRSDLGERMRDGIYVLRRAEMLHVKRIAVHPAAGRLTIRSDNPRYPSWECDAGEIEVIGRVVWVGRRV